jgi:glutaredoxin
LNKIQVIMYSKENCSLCEKAKKILEEISTEIPLEINEVDIYRVDELLEKYQIMIPVVEMDGEEIEYGIIHKDVIRKRLLEKIKNTSC